MKYLALCALFLCSCGDGRIVRALNSGPAYYPVYSGVQESDVHELIHEQAHEQAIQNWLWSSSSCCDH